MENGTGTGLHWILLPASLTVKSVDAHYKVNSVVKLLVVLFRGEVG